MNLKMGNLMIMKIFLLTMGILDSIVIAIEVLVMMRRRFVPSSYQRDLRNRLQNLKQGSKPVDDYFKEMELLFVRSGIREDEE